MTDLDKEVFFERAELLFKISKKEIICNDTE